MLPAAVNLNSITPQIAASILTLKVLAGDPTSLPSGTVVRGAVNAVADGKASLTVNGQPLTVRAQPGLTAGVQLAVLVTSSGVEAVVIPNTSNTTDPTAPPPAATLVPQAQTPVPTAAIVVAAATPAPSSPPASASAAPTTEGDHAATEGTVSTTTTATTAAATPSAAAVAASTRPAAALPTAPAVVVAGDAVRPPPATTSTNVIGARSTPVSPGIPAPNGQTSAAVAPASTRTGSTSSQQTSTSGQPAAVANIGTPTISARIQASATQLSLVDVLPPNAQGMPQVRVDGRPTVVSFSTVPLTPGTRLVAQVIRTPLGAQIITPTVTNTPQATTAIAAALLKQTRAPALPDALPQLASELNTASKAASTASTSSATPTAKPEVANAVNQLRNTVSTLLPDTLRPPTAGELKALVENGGQQYEGKLAGQTQGEAGPSAQDLKAGLLKLFDVLPAVAHAQFPAAKATLDGIEQQQASNVLSLQTGGPLVMQVPFPDGNHWQTLHLAIEPEQSKSNQDGSQSSPFRMLMHVPLTDLGDTWIDAGMNGNQFRAVIYLDSASVRNQVKQELPSLQSDLKQSGFSEVMLDVRPTSDLSDKQKQSGAAMSAGVPTSTSVIDTRV